MLHPQETETFAFGVKLLSSTNRQTMLLWDWCVCLYKLLAGQRTRIYKEQRCPSIVVQESNRSKQKDIFFTKLQT